jgi:hypothetical protein
MCESVKKIDVTPGVKQELMLMLAVEVYEQVTDTPELR